MSISRWVHINYKSRDGWVLPIWTAHNESTLEGRCHDFSEDIYELGIYISTRLSMLPRVYVRVREEVDELYQAVAKHLPCHEWTDNHEGYGFDIPDSLQFSLLLDLDSLLFELNSCCELVGKLFEQLYGHLEKSLPHVPVGCTIRKILQDAGQETQWFEDLDNHRNFFIHEGAPFFAVDLTNSAQADLLIMKNNLRRFDDPRDRVSLSQLAHMVSGFEQSKGILQKHLIGLFRN